MAITKVEITGMPGPGWWDILVQWGGISVQAVAALGTLWAVVVALRVANRGDRHRAAEYDERGTIVSGVVLPEVANYLRMLVLAGVQLHHLRQALVNLEAAGSDKDRVIAKVARVKEMGIRLTKTVPLLQLSATQKIFDHLHFMPEAKGRRVAAALGLVDSVRRDLEAVLQYSETDPIGGRFEMFQAEQSIGRIAGHLLHVLPVGETEMFRKGLGRAMQAVDNDFSYAGLKPEE
ncbi:hypothetical protein LMG26858_04400 [Achromobacter anxifer]|uniref:Uncharacterized protein n=1 Tax=Achromobacter anxifer TaxID=1287737 RepID=A0A6S7ECN8_9BURK|nr:hypothetical protein [Achromobacter anxifer]CAB3904327.1 hypothetical protein LMG26858_04400 [Achromobacter anxifer]